MNPMPQTPITGEEKNTPWLAMLLLLVAFQIGIVAPAAGQAGFDDDRVMLQGFYWESCRHGDADLPQFGTN